MPVEYDKYYQTENLFGAPYPELIRFYSAISQKGKLLDLGCGQGRDAVALARLGFEVVGVDNSSVGIGQLNAIARHEKLPLTGIVGDIYKYRSFDEFDFILLDSMFHFGKKDKEKEVGLLKTIFQSAKPEVLITICIQQTGNKIKILEEVVVETPNLGVEHQETLEYIFTDKKTNHRSETTYELITIKKLHSDTNKQ